MSLGTVRPLSATRTLKRENPTLVFFQVLADKVLAAVAFSHSRSTGFDVHFNNQQNRSDAS